MTVSGVVVRQYPMTLAITFSHFLFPSRMEKLILTIGTAIPPRYLDSRGSETRENNRGAVEADVDCKVLIKDLTPDEIAL